MTRRGWILFAAMAFIVNPAVALALRVSLLHEPFTLGIAIGFVLIVLGSVLATRRTPASEPASSAEFARS